MRRKKIREEYNNETNKDHFQKFPEANGFG